MAPPTGPLHLDVEAISGICGSISIACWVVVFSPQILENFRRSSADGLSLHFIIVWLIGDVFNILGAVLQGVLPTMVILAFYYTIADIVLLLQCFYYRGFTFKDEVIPPAPKPSRAEINERTSLISSQAQAHPHSHPHHPLHHERERRGSDWSNLSPAVPLLDGPPTSPISPPTTLQTIIWNALAIFMVCAAGVMGWVLSRRYTHSGDGDKPAPGDGDHDGNQDELDFNFWGQVFGWLCAALYLGSRLPQILLNYRRKSTEGVSMLFFLFACLGNLTYVLSIFAYDPRCGPDGCDARHGYARYIMVNLSWLAGSMGTLLLDMGIFVQFFMYRRDDESEYEDEDEEDYDGENSDSRSIDEDRWDQRPLLERSDSRN